MKLPHNTSNKLVHLSGWTLTIVLSFLGCCLGCKEFVEIDPPRDQIVDEKVYQTDETATAAINGIYAKMMTDQGLASGGFNSVTLLAGRSAGELINYSGNLEYQQFSNNNLLSNNAALKSGLWTQPYQYIYFANLILENLEVSGNLSVSTKQKLRGEAKFLRAFNHFYLTNLFGEIPYIVSTDYRINAIARPNSKEEIYNLLIKDLLGSKIDLSDAYPSSERVRPNKYAVMALLARVYLYHQNWIDAERESSEIISKNALYSLVLDDLKKVFLKGSQETILQFAVPSTQSVNTREGSLFILNSAPGAASNVVLDNNLYAAFESGDKRLVNWVGTFTAGSSSWHYPLKYRVKTGSSPSTEYSVVLRLAEQYLIRAEARIQQSKVSQGIEDLNIIRARSRAASTSLVPNPLPQLSATLSKADALLAVEKERRIELFSEWGHRWLDLKRTNRVDVVLAPLRGPNWQSTDVLYPIPATELLNAIHLKQNPGYQ